MYEYLTYSANRPDHIMLFRRYVSRSAIGKVKAVLEGLGLDQPTIDTCIRANPILSYTHIINVL